MIKTCENSNNLLDEYSMKYCYMYIIYSPSNFIINNINDELVFVNYFNYKDNYYLILWSKQNIKIDFIEYKNPIYSTNFLVKTEDTYVFAKIKIFKKIKDVINQQYLDLTYKKYDIQKQILSSVWLNVLTSNKLLYYQYFIDKNIILNTKIKKLSLEKINNYSKDYIIKAPYSSGSFCIKTKYKLKKECFIDEGVIISKLNYSLEYIELKIHTFQGKILYANVKNKITDKIVLNDNLKYTFTNDNKDKIDNNLIYISESQILIDKYKLDIINICNKVYHLMNEFLLIMKYKLNYELNNFIKPLKLNRKIFYSFFNNRKIKKLKN